MSDTKGPTKTSMSPGAAYVLLIGTALCVGAACYLALYQEGRAVLRPVATVIVSGLAGGLVCVAAKDTRSFDNGGWIFAIYSWLLTAVAAASTSLSVFILALVAFTQNSSYHYTGLGLFGAITGYLGASVALTGAITWRASLQSPLDLANRDLTSQLKQLLPILQPQVNSLLEEAILGPPMPPYKGTLIVKAERPLLSNPLVKLELLFTTATTEVPRTNLDSENVYTRSYPVLLRGSGKQSVQKSEASSKVDLDLLYHIPTAAGSPFHQSVSIPVTGASQPTTFSAPLSKVDKNGLPPDSLLELRCRGTLVQIIDLQLLLKAPS